LALALVSALRMNTNSNRAKPAASVATTDIMALLRGMGFCGNVGDCTNTSKPLGNKLRAQLH
jgi:hypothetical protein